MRHGSKIKKFGREKGQRVALMRSLAISLIERNSIQTTVPKAKALRPIVEKLVTRAKDNSLSSRRLLISRLHNEKIVNKLITELGPKYTDRKGGYTRIVKTGVRLKDASPMAIIQFV